MSESKERLVGEIPCIDCEGSGWVMQMIAPTGERHLMPCPSAKARERVERLHDWRDAPPVMSDERRRRNELVGYVLSQLRLCNDTDTKCPRCGGRGYELRLWQPVDESAA